nr:MAG TPA: hypothetical protein [Caudoviricetes sp.]
MHIRRSFTKATPIGYLPKPLESLSKTWKRKGRLCNGV